MKVYIPTRSRLDRQITLQTFKDAHLCVHSNEYEAHRKRYGKNVLCIPDSVKGICRVRQWILDQHDSKKHGPQMCMMDDDLRFYQRNGMKLVKLDFPQNLLLDYEDALTDYAHAGISPREGNNRVPYGTLECKRMMRVIGYNVDMVRKAKCEFHSERWFTMDDFDMTLKLLKKGLPNKVIYTYAQNQNTSGDKGGASDYRTVESHNRSAKALAEAHAPFVKLVEKETKSAWKAFGGKRLDVVVSWVKAFESSRDIC